MKLNKEKYFEVESKILRTFEHQFMKLFGWRAQVLKCYQFSSPGNWENGTFVWRQVREDLIGRFLKEEVLVTRGGSAWVHCVNVANYYELLS